MKTRLIIGMVIGVSAGAFAQEYDDMYFRSKDREVLTASVASKAAEKDSYSSFKKKHFEEVTMLDEYINPSDSYSARNINPEYIARSSSAQASADEGNYFVENYSSQATTPITYYSGNPNASAYNNPSNWYNSGWFGPSIYGSMYSPYSMYGMNGMNSMYGMNGMYGMYDPWMNPYRSGISYGMSMSTFWGNAWNPWRMGLFGNNGFNPYCPSPSWGNPYALGYGTPGTVVINERTKTNYSKRPSNNAVNTDIATRNNRTSTGVLDNSTNRSRTSNDYYVRPSRRSYTDFNSSSYSDNYSGGRTSGNISRSYDNSGSNFSSPSRSSGSSSFSAPSRSSSSGSVGSSSGSSGGSRRGGN